MTEARVMAAVALVREVAAWRAAGLRVAVLSGDFDVLAVAHARAIAAARATADRVAVVVRPDPEVGSRRGESRPVLAAAERARLVAALRGVDGVAVADAAALAAHGFDPAGLRDAEADLADPVERLRARGNLT